MSKRTGFGIKRLIMSGDERKRLGVIVQFENGISKQFTGGDTTRQAAAFADQYETKISVISSPDTIYRDMQGTRRPIVQTKRQIQDTMFLPELRTLSSIGRKDLFTSPFGRG